MASSIRPRASGGFRGRAAIVLLGVVAALRRGVAVREFEISIRDRRVEGSASTLRVKRGETVLLRWRTDEAVSLHVHGYDVQANLSAASPDVHALRSDGRRSLPDHGTRIRRRGRPDRSRPKSHREVTLLYLEVLPE